MQWDTRFAARTAYMKRSTIREILKLTARPDVISFAGGLPAPEFFPVERVQEAVDLALSERGQVALQYSTTEGMPELRELIAARLSDARLTISPDNILITTGSQQGLDLIGRVLVDEGDRVVVENPTYLGMLMAWRPYALRYIPAPTDTDGLNVDALEPLLQQKPKLIYVVPNYQNPGGFTLSVERRERLVQLLARYEVPLVEDNPYGELCFSGSPRPSILSIDANNLGISTPDGHVIYVGTFSKVLSPGLRIGYVVATEQVIDKLVQAKQSADLHSSTLDQFITYEVARDGFLDRHIAHLCEVYRERRDVMLAAMERYFPAEVSWSKPDGGLFLLVTAPAQVDTTELLAEAIKRGVAFVPGADFHIDGGGQNTFRLNFSNARPDLVEAGIQRLGDLLKEALAHPVK
ncbi:MAG TPA: PLP-dependent aminotransferase family protein [Spirillospora sp.]|nr:PLP-dependent aminotransferase family protein [Spirillospora sp.]